MSQFPGRPTTLRVYDPESPELATYDSIDSEFIQYASPPILLWKYIHSTTKTNTDELGELYGEAEERYYEETPITIYCLAEKSPIIQELSRFGLTQIEEINFTSNTTDLIERMGRLPEPADIIRLSYLVGNPVQGGQKHTHTFYKIASALPIDDALHSHVDTLINAEQTALEHVPRHVREWLDKE